MNLTYEIILTQREIIQVLPVLKDFYASYDSGFVSIKKSSLSNNSDRFGYIVKFNKNRFIDHVKTRFHIAGQLSIEADKLRIACKILQLDKHFVKKTLETMNEDREYIVDEIEL